MPEQPDLNWRNPEVREAVYDVLRFWLRRGIDGFRVDVLWHLIKDEEFRDNPPNPDFRPGEERPNHALIPLYSADRPEVHEVVEEMRRVLEAFLLSTHLDRCGELVGRQLDLRPDEGVIVAVSPASGW